jgi:putative transposase
MENPADNSLSYGRGYVYSIQYHIVWCTKYRNPVLVGETERFFREEVLRLAREYRFKVTAFETMPDHVHLLVDCSPQFNIPDMVRILKGTTARRLFVTHPHLRAKLWGGHLWNPSYCVVTVSDRTREQIRHYIESQKEK